MTSLRKKIFFFLLITLSGVSLPLIAMDGDKKPDTTSDADSKKESESPDDSPKAVRIAIKELQEKFPDANIKEITAQLMEADKKARTETIAPHHNKKARRDARRKAGSDAVAAKKIELEQQFNLKKEEATKMAPAETETEKSTLLNEKKPSDDSTHSEMPPDETLSSSSEKLDVSLSQYPVTPMPVNLEDSTIPSFDGSEILDLKEDTLNNSSSFDTELKTSNGHKTDDAKDERSDTALSTTTSSDTLDASTIDPTPFDPSKSFDGSKTLDPKEDTLNDSSSCEPELKTSDSFVTHDGDTDVITPESKSDVPVSKDADPLNTDSTDSKISSESELSSSSQVLDVSLSNYQVEPISLDLTSSTTLSLDGSKTLDPKKDTLNDSSSCEPELKTSDSFATHDGDTDAITPESKSDVPVSKDADRLNTDSDDYDEAQKIWNKRFLEAIKKENSTPSDSLSDETVVDLTAARVKHTTSTPDETRDPSTPPSSPAADSIPLKSPDPLKDKTPQETADDLAKALQKATDEVIKREKIVKKQQEALDRVAQENADNKFARELEEKERIKSDAPLLIEEDEKESGIAEGTVFIPDHGAVDLSEEKEEKEEKEESEESDLWDDKAAAPKESTLNDSTIARAINEAENGSIIDDPAFIPAHDGAAAHDLLEEEPEEKNASNKNLPPKNSVENNGLLDNQNTWRSLLARHASNLNSPMVMIPTIGLYALIDGQQQLVGLFSQNQATAITGMLFAAVANSILPNAQNGWAVMGSYLGTHFVGRKALTYFARTQDGKNVIAKYERLSPNKKAAICLSGWLGAFGVARYIVSLLNN